MTNDNCEGGCKWAVDEELAPAEVCLVCGDVNPNLTPREEMLFHAFMTQILNSVVAERVIVTRADPETGHKTVYREHIALVPKELDDGQGT